MSKYFYFFCITVNINLFDIFFNENSSGSMTDGGKVSVETGEKRLHHVSLCMCICMEVDDEPIRYIDKIICTCIESTICTCVESKMFELYTMKIR